MTIELETLSLQELRELKARVERAITSFEDRKKKEAMAELEARAREMGFSLAELTGGARKRRSSGPVAAKFANPADPTQTWSGRGRRPKWVTEALSEGRKLSDLAI